MDKRLDFYRKHRDDESRYIHSTAIIYPCVILGKNVKIHEYCTIGTQGFGFCWDPDEKKWIHARHVGGVVIGDNVEIFPHTNIDRGTIGDTIVGEGTKIDHYCHIGHNTQTGKHTIICAGTILGGSCIVGNNVWIGPNSTIRNGITIYDNIFFGSQSNVVRDCESGYMYMGNPARKVREFAW